MRILLDENTSHRFKQALPGHEVIHQEDLGWKGKRNGVLLDLAEEAGFEIFVTVDKQLRFQQNPAKRKLSVIILDVHPISPSNQLACVTKVAEVCEQYQRSSFYVVKKDDI